MAKFEYRSHGHGEVSINMVSLDLGLAQSNHLYRDLLAIPLIAE
jgi:hypothetical protein